MEKCLRFSFNGRKDNKTEERKEVVFLSNCYCWVINFYSRKQGKMPYSDTKQQAGSF